MLLTPETNNETGATVDVVDVDVDGCAVEVVGMHTEMPRSMTLASDGEREAVHLLQAGPSFSNAGQRQGNRFAEVH